MSSTRRTMALAIGCCLLLAQEAHSHTITLDGNAADWRGLPGPIADLGRIARDSLGGGEFVWRDSAGDQRPGWPARPHDLRELRITGDGTSLYVMALLAGPVATAGDSTPQLQLAIDLDRFFGSGATSFVGGAATSTAPNAAYEYLLQTRFGSGQAPRLVNAQGADVAAAITGSISGAGVIEIAIPWTALGSTEPAVNPLRFTAALFLASAADVPYDPADGTTSRAADVITQNAGPGTTGTTAAEVADGTIDYWFDVYIDARGEAISPVVVNEIWFSGGVKSQWIEIVNASQNLIPLASYKVGDAALPASGGSMAQLTSTLLSPGDSYVLARNGATFFSNYGFRASAEAELSDPATPDLMTYFGWASTTQFNINASGADVLVLDGCNTVVDVLSFKNAQAWPGVKPHPGVQSTHSLERSRPDRDTDNCAADFGDEPLPNPGIATALAGVFGGTFASALRWAPPSPNPTSGNVTLSLQLDRVTRLGVDVVDVSGRRVRTLVPTSQQRPGELRMRWDGRDDRGVPAGPGLYFVRARTPQGARAVRVELVR